MLAAADSPDGMHVAGWNLKPMRGDMAGYWRVEVNNRWRLVFRYEDGVAVDVDFVDYH